MPIPPSCVCQGSAFRIYPELRLVPPAVAVAGWLRDFRPDLVHLVSPVSLGVAGLRAARALGRPVVASYHTDIPGYARRYGLGACQRGLWSYFRWLHNQADLTLCPSGYTRDQLATHSFRNLAVWGRGVDTELFNPGRHSAEWRRRLTGSVDAPLLLYAGRLAVEKRVEWLRLVIVGDGPRRAHLERLFAGTRTIFTGCLHGEELAAAYASADIFAFPSANETFGNVVLEAMASGPPVVTARAGGPVDHIQHGRPTWLTTGHRFHAQADRATHLNIRRSHP